MQKDNMSFLKTALIEYVKSHDEYRGKILEFIDHIDKAAEVAQSLPADIKEEMRRILINFSFANGITSIFFR